MKIEPIEALRLHLLHGYPGKFEGMRSQSFYGGPLVGDPWEAVRLSTGDDDEADWHRTAHGVYQPRLPADITQSMRPCLLLRRSGPGRAHDFAPLSILTVDTRAYAPRTHPRAMQMASRISDVAYMELRYLRRGKIPHPEVLRNVGLDSDSGVMVFWAKPAGGPIDTVDPDLDIPCVFRSYQLLVEDPAPAC